MYVGLENGDRLMTKIIIAKRNARALGLVVGIAWLITCLFSMIWTLDLILSRSVTIYGLVYPLVLASCVIVGFVGGTVLSKLLASFITVPDTPSVETFFSPNAYTLAGRSAAALLSTVVFAMAAPDHFVMGETSPSGTASSPIQIGDNVQATSSPT